MTATATQFRIVAKPFGYPMYAAVDIPGPNWTDRADEATVYDDRDNPEIKLAYWKGQMAYWGLDNSTCEVEYI